MLVQRGVPLSLQLRVADGDGVLRSPRDDSASAQQYNTVQLSRTSHVLAGGGATVGEPGRSLGLTNLP